MHPQFLPTLQDILPWAQANPDIQGVLLIGSQARSAPAADQWSDLDLMVFAGDPQRLMQDNTWFERFGEVACFFDEIVPLHFNNWRWCVKRVLYADHRDVDFSILPYDHLADVLSDNQEILSRGCQVLYDATPGCLDRQIRALLQSLETQTAHPLTEQELRQVVNELLFHVIWAFKKIKRSELWVAVNCINSHMKNLLLQLIEAHNISIRQQPGVLMYNGRFLEQRAGPEILAQLSACFTKYDPADAVATLERLFEITYTLSKAICEKNGCPFDAAQFERVHKIYSAMKAGEDEPAPVGAQK